MPPAPRLKLIQTPTSGHDRIDPEAVPSGCLVCNVHEHEAAIAEYVLAAMLHWVIRLADLDRGFRAGDWHGGVARPGHMHHEIGGRTLGIVGYGRIGREVARRASAFGMRIVAATRASPGGGADHEIWPLDRLDEMLAASDFVLVACPLSESTRGLLDARRLSCLRTDAVLINVARAAIIEEAALYAALRTRRIGGAILDVWYGYPTPDAPDAAPSRFPFHALDNVLMTPHAAAWTHETVARRWRCIAANLDRLARGDALENVVIARNHPTR